jgi:hypothetical protein
MSMRLLYFHQNSNCQGTQRDLTVASVADQRRGMPVGGSLRPCIEHTLLLALGEYKVLGPDLT